MTEEKKETPETSENDAKAKIKALFNEVLDEREAKAAAARETEEKEKETPENKRTAEKPTLMQTLFGFGG